MTFIARAQWGARPPKYLGNAIGAHPLGVVVHYSAANLGSFPDSECDDKVRGIQRYHQDTKGYADIAYSSLVCPHGNEFEGRGPGKGSAANGTTAANLAYYAVCVLGGPKDTPSVLTLAGIGTAIARYRKAGAGDAVLGHRDLIPTACPGEALYAYVTAGHWAKLAVAVKAAVIRILAKPFRATVRPPARFPLPAGHWFGVRSANFRNHSGVNTADQPAIRAIQRKVGALPDGDYGPKTKALVIRWQRSHRLTADGAVGAVTWRSLNQ